MREESKRGFREGLLLGLAFALPFALITAVVGYSFVTMKKSAMRRGWPLVEAVVAARPLSTGETLSLEDLEVRGVPEQMVTGDTVLPAQLNASIGRRLRAPLAAGQMLHRAFVEEEALSRDQEVARACATSEAKPLSAESLQTILSIQQVLAQEASR